MTLSVCCHSKILYYGNVTKRRLLSILIKEDFFLGAGGQESGGWDKAIWRIVRTSEKILATPLWRLIGVTSCGYIGFVFKHIYLFIFVSTYRQD